MPVVSSGHPSTHRRSIPTGRLSLSTKSSSLFALWEDTLAPRRQLFVMILDLLGFQAVVKLVTRCHHVPPTSPLTFKSYADQKSRFKASGSCQLLRFSLLAPADPLVPGDRATNPLRRNMFTYGNRQLACDRLPHGARLHCTQCKRHEGLRAYALT